MTLVAPKRRTLMVVGALALLLLLGAVVAYVAVASRHERRRREIYCWTQFSTLNQLFLAGAVWDPAKTRPHSGRSLWLALRKEGRGVPVGAERMLLCPDDPSAHATSSPEDSALWDSVDLADPPEGMTSYAGRDFVNYPFGEATSEAEAIGACLHHEGAAIVAFMDGSVRFMRLEELGLEREDEKIVGPKSKSPILRPLLR